MIDLAKIVGITFSNLDAAKQAEIVAVLTNTANGIDGKSPFEILQEFLTTKSTKLAVGSEYVLYSGNGNGDVADKFVKARIAAGVSAGTIGKTEYGKFVIDFDKDPTAKAVIENLKIALKDYPTFDSTPERFLLAYQDLAFNAGSPEFARNAVASGKPIAAFVDGASSTRSYAVMEIPELITAPPDTVLNGAKTSSLGTTAEAFLGGSQHADRNMRTLASELAASTSKIEGKPNTALDVYGKINLYGIADSANLQILGQKTSALQTYSLDTLKAISEKGILLENGKLAPNTGKAFYADLIKPIGEYSGKVTAEFGKVLEVAGFKGAGAALGAGFLVTGVANVVVAYKEGEQWNGAVQHAVREGFAQAGQFAFGALVFGVGAALALSFGAPANDNQVEVRNAA